MLPFEKRECWYVRFSDDVAESFVFMERGRLYIVNDEKAEDPLLTDGYICTYKDFTVKAIYLDELMKSVDGNLKKENLVVEIEAKLLREIKD